SCASLSTADGWPVSSAVALVPRPFSITAVAKNWAVGRSSMPALLFCRALPRPPPSRFEAICSRMLRKYPSSPPFYEDGLEGVLRLGRSAYGSQFLVAARIWHDAVSRGWDIGDDGSGSCWRGTQACGWHDRVRRRSVRAFRNAS